MPRESLAKLTMAEIPHLLETLQISPEKVSAFEVILHQFLVLEKIDREVCRATPAGYLFSMVFDEDATICSCPRFAELNSTVWFDAPHDRFCPSFTNKILSTSGPLIVGRAQP